MDKIHKENKKKRNEELILTKFLKEYYPNAKIYSYVEANKIYPNYNNENPDFIIRLDDEDIGVELFQLFLTNNFKEYKDKKGILRKAKNLVHYKKVNPNKFEFIEGEDLGKIVDERIKSKYEISKTYVTQKLWFLGYSNNILNWGLIEDMFDDNVVDKIISYIKENSKVINAVEEIFLYSCYSESKLIKIRMKPFF